VSASALLPAVALLLFIVTGCGSDNLGASSADEEMVFHGQIYSIRGLDPAAVSDAVSILSIARINEGLLQYSYLERPYQVEPLLAQALPDVSEEGLTYTFKIREGIYFQDDPCFTASDGKGRELVAQDFVYSMKRIADIKNSSPGFWVFDDRIIGLDAWRSETRDLKHPTRYDERIPGLSAPDRYTLQIRLKRPYPQLLWVLCMHYSFVVAREAVEFYGDQYINHPVGTGPYTLHEWRRNYSIEFVRNPKWAETGRREVYPSRGASDQGEIDLLNDAGKELPIIDRIVEFVVSDPSTRWLMFLTGRLGTSGITKGNWDAVMTDEKRLDESLTSRGITLSSAPTMTLIYFGFNMDDPVVGPNKELRQAMAYAFDTEKWLSQYNFRIIRPNGPIPPGVAGYSNRPVPYAFDLPRARQLMMVAGYPEGIDPKTDRRLTIQVEIGNAESPEMREGVELVASFMDKIGIRIVPKYSTLPAFFSRLERRQAQSFRLSWIADYPDAQNFLQLFYGPNASPGPNRTNFSNTEFDLLYEQFRDMLDSPERSAFCQRMVDIVIEECPLIFLGIPLDHELQQPWLKNRKYHDFPYGMEKYWRVDSSEMGR
jgi:oligopeptide transport system substrate-binding protein